MAAPIFILKSAIPISWTTCNVNNLCHFFHFFVNVNPVRQKALSDMVLLEKNEQVKLLEREED